jgi:hypothetical protein
MNRNRREARYKKARPVYPKAHTLYRHLLKQSRRLEDPASRYFFQTQTRNQFRHSGGHSFSMVGSMIQPKREQQLNKALYHLARITRANMGVPEDMEYVVGMTYGLIGPVMSEREKYRRLLNFSPDNFRLHPLPMTNEEHIRKVVKVVKVEEECGVGLGESADNRLNNGEECKINVMDQLHAYKVQKYEELIRNDDDFGQIAQNGIYHHNNDRNNHPQRKDYSGYIESYLNSIGYDSSGAKINHEILFPQNSDQIFTIINDPAPKPSLPHQKSASNTNTINTHNNPVFSIFDSIQHLKTNTNPLKLSPYVYIPFKYGQFIVIPDPMTPSNTAVVKKQSALGQFKQKLYRKWVKMFDSNVQNVNRSDPNVETNPQDGDAHSNGDSTPQPTRLHPNQPTQECYQLRLAYRDSPPNDDTASDHVLPRSKPFLPTPTLYATKNPVHPRVQLSFEYQIDHFMYSILYFLSTKDSFMRSAFRAWPDFGWVPLEQEAYDRIFQLNGHYSSENGGVVDPREAISEIVKDFEGNGGDLGRFGKRMGSSVLDDSQLPFESDLLLSKKLKRHLDVELPNGEIVNLKEDDLTVEQKHELIVNLSEKKGIFLEKYNFPKTFYSKLVVPSEVYDFTTRSELLSTQKL